MIDRFSPEEEAPLTGHEYDGIQERDNPLPMWWLATFFATIIFSFIYYTHYEISGVALSQVDELNIEMKKIESLKQASAAKGSSYSDEQLLAMMTASGVKEQGAQVFTAKCAACHGQNGEGLIGPNLTDRFWIHGKGSGQDILTVVQKGVLDKGMPAWQGVIPDAEVIAVSAHLFAIKGTAVLNGKAPQGEEVK